MRPPFPFSYWGECMWKRLKRICTAILIGLLLLPLLFCASFTSYAVETTEYITLTMQEWSDFKTDWNEQMKECQMLKANLTALKANSTEQEKMLLELQEKSQNLENRLLAVQSSLTLAQSSLKQAKSEIDECKKESTRLKIEIDEYKHKVRLAKRQRDAWAIVAGTLAAYIMYDHLR